MPPSTPINGNVAEVGVIAKHSQFLDRYYPQSIDGFYYPEISEDYRPYASHPKVKELLARIRQQDETERRSKLAIAEDKARRRYENLQGDSLAVPVIGAGGAVAATGQVFGASLLAATSLAIVVPIAAVVAAGFGYFIYKAITGKQKQKDGFAENHVKLQAIDFRTKDLEYNQKIKGTELQKSLLRELQEKRKPIEQEIQRIELQNQYDLQHPKNTISHLVLGATAGAAIGGLLVPVLGAVVGLLIGITLAAIGSELSHRLQRNSFVSKRLTLQDQTEKTEVYVERSNQVEKELDTLIRSLKPQPPAEKNAEWKEKVKTHTLSDQPSKAVNR